VATCTGLLGAGWTETVGDGAAEDDVGPAVVAGGDEAGAVVDEAPVDSW